MNKLQGYFGLLLVAMAMLVSSGLHSQFLPETYSHQKSGVQTKQRISGGYTHYLDTVTDDKYPTDMASGSWAWRANYKHRKVIDRITISIKDTSKAMSKFDYLFNMTVDTFDCIGRHGSFNITMRFSYDPASHQAYIDKSVYQFRDCHQFCIKINSILDSSLVSPTSFSASTMQTNFTIESEIIVDRYYLEKYSDTVSSLSHTFIGVDKLKIQWTPKSPSGPNQYELEWAYVDTAGINPDSVRYDFIHNCSRVVLSQTFYTINTVYDAGVIVYRVRRIKPDSVYFKYTAYGDWLPSSMPDKGFVKKYRSSNRRYIGSHEGMGKNWDYQVAFAEEGLKKEVVNYFDGSLKRRQGVTLSNTNNFALVDESIYDFHGREVIKIIPAPSDSNTIRYYKKFNQNADGYAYSAHDFDTSATMADKCNGHYKADTLGRQSGAGRYYSPANPDLTNENAAIPDAQGYPLVQTQLMPDPTGRVASQGGIGLVHQLGSGHETKYTYGTANQAELDKLFGSEVGVARHYKKNAVVDPNGQMSISYIDQHGRVVATALSGGVPGMVDTLPGFTAAQYAMTDINPNNKMRGNAIVTDYGFDVSTAGTHKVYYRLESPDFTFGCLGLARCYSCRYDLEFLLTDDCGSTLMQFRRPVGNLSDTSCDDLEFSLQDSVSSILGTVSSSGDSVSFTLGIGTYHLIKKLTVNTDSIDTKIDEVILNDSNCFKTISDFIDDEIAQIDFSDCECDTCGFDTLSYCETRRELMLDDLRPGGQYFTYDEMTLQVPDSSSILRVWGDGWINNYIDGSQFRDEAGNIDTVWINGIANVPNGMDINYFIGYFKPSWAEALLPYHPEYCYYKFCVDSLESSYIYDEAMMGIDNYDTALYYGYLNSIGNHDEYPQMIQDPLFIKSNGSPQSTFNSFSAKLASLSSYTIGSVNDPLKIGAASTNLWQFAMALGFCDNISDSLERESCFKFYYNNSIVTNNWMNDAAGRDNYWDKFKTLYYQVKQKYIEDRMDLNLTGGNFCVKKVGPTCGDPAYKTKISHFYRYQFANPLENNADSIKALRENLLDSLDNFGTCEASVTHWDEALSLCPSYSTYRDSILYHLLRVCKSGSLNPSSPNIFGTSDVPPGLTSGLRFTSFDQVLKHFLGSNYKSELCNTDLINSPKSYAHDYLNSPPQDKGDCYCSNLASDIRTFKGCTNPLDTVTLSPQGENVNTFINLVVHYDLINSVSSVPLDTLPDLDDAANALFGRSFGVATSAMHYQQNIRGNLSSVPAYQKYLNVFYGTKLSDGCQFVITLRDTNKRFTNIAINRPYRIQPSGQGHFIFKFYYNTLDSATADVYTTCFYDLILCSDVLPDKYLGAFTSYFNHKYSSNLDSTEILDLLKSCQKAERPNFINAKSYDGSVTYCTVAATVAAENDQLIRSLNHMMRDPGWWRTTMPGFITGTDVETKRTLTTEVHNFHCPGKVDFLLPTTGFKSISHYFTSFNYFWRAPRYTTSTFTAGGISTHDTIEVNNYNSHPYFAGGAWIGAKCDIINDSSCFISFGDPYKQLGVGGRPVLDEIDSLGDLFYDKDLEEMVVRGMDRSHPSDYVLLTFRTCFKSCPEGKDTTITYHYSYLQFLKGNGMAQGSNNNLKLNIQTHGELTNPFMDMLNGLAKGGLLNNSSAQTDILSLHKTQKFSNYYTQLNPDTSYLYYKYIGSNDDSLIEGSLGKLNGSAMSGNCRFVIRKTGNDRTWDFTDITRFKNLNIDFDKTIELYANGQMDQAGYYFTATACVDNIFGVEVATYPVRGWTSCWNLFRISSISGDGKDILELPESFAGNCLCHSCPEMKKWSDSLYAEYPNLYPGHANYETIVANYINRKLNTNLSFVEIQSHWDQCGVGRREFIPTPQCHYRLSVDNDDCQGHADTALLLVMQQTNLEFGIASTRFSDSTEYCLDFSGLSAAQIRMLQDSLAKYFSSPYCNAFKKLVNYRTSWDIVMYNLDSANMESDSCSKDAFEDWFGDVKSNLFASSSDLDVSVTDNIVYSGDNFIDPDATTWIAKIELSDLSADQRKLLEDTLQKWTGHCGGFGIQYLYYRPQLAGTTGDDAICLKSNNTVCYSCDSLRQYLSDYQLDSLPDGGGLVADNIETILRSKTGRELEVYEGATDAQSECVSCSNKSLFVCEEPSDKALTFIALLNHVARNKELSNSSYSLGAAFTSKLNAIKPEDCVLNAPKYKYAANTRGGWSATIQYNTTQSDVIFFGIDTNDFQKKFNPGIDTFVQFTPIAEHGYVSGFSILAKDSLGQYFTYNMMIPGLSVTRCCAIPSAMLCPRPYAREYPQYDPPCKEEEILQAISNGTQLYYQYLDSLKRSLAMAYEIHCLQFALEDIRLGKYEQRYHTTLYYYDQAGNLIKTVPPAGVNELSLVTLRLDSLDKYRREVLDTNKFVITRHQLATNYQYNSLNQLVWQHTPDGDTSKFWYDRLGRLVLSQNAVQRSRSNSSHKVYSYTRYDALGRMCEVGEITNWAVNNDSLIADVAYYNHWLAGKTARTQITKTFYDYVVMPGAGNQFDEGQRNLRNRVSCVAYYDAYASDSTQYTRATHYSYDIHGNVDHLVHEFPDMAMVNGRYKHLVYNYDLISGKVHSVAYQAGQTDQWYHRYDYDADNRLTLAETSTDSVIWDKDAEYKYYKHGPLARTLLGEHAVQGVDYVYTIHGWLKGVNSNTLVAGRDVGQDGDGSLAQYTARDAYGFTLGYYSNVSGGSFDGDYRSIGSTSFEAATSGSPLATGSANLYNGNISHMVSAVNVLFSANSSSPLATVYHYDQLNRIKSVQTYNGINSGSNSWNSGSLQTAYKETFKYDPNGNITNLTRNNKTTAIDNLTYHYTANTNQLAYVDDAVSGSTETGDIDDESSGNYTYDRIGNLVYDRTEEIDSIKWTVYGKISEIIRKSGSTRPNLSFRYDAMGQRVLKIVKRSPTENDWDYTWYVRDAQGNVMATYSKKNILLNDGDSSIYRLIDNSLIGQMNSDSLASLIRKYFSGSQFYTDLAQTIEDRGLTDDYADLYDADSMLDYDNNFAQLVFQKFCDHYTGIARTSFFNTLWTDRSAQIMDLIDASCLDLNALVTAIMNNDPTDDLLNTLYTIDPGKFTTVYFNLGGPPFPPPTLSTMRSYIKAQPRATASAAINAQYTSSQMETVIEALSSTLQQAAFSAYDFCTLMTNIGTCMPTNSFSSWYDFVYDEVDNSIVKNLIILESDGLYLNTQLITHDPKAMNKIAENFPDAISDVLRNTEDLDFTTYLFYIYKKFGRTVFNQVLDDVGTITLQKTLTLDELHIYGSSRHGIKKPQARLVSKIYELDEIESDGEFAYNDATDSAIVSVNYHYFKRTLSYKQYELTNHLGNVLATIADRKTPHTSSGSVDYYEADVTTAQMYYAFGSAIKELSYAYSSGGDTSKYRYGFNGEEMEDNIDGDGMVYDLGARFYDARLGRMFSLDPLARKYAYWSAYTYCGNNPINSVDIDGMGNDDDLAPGQYRLKDNDSPWKLADKFGVKDESGGNGYKQIQQWNNESNWKVGDVVWIADPQSQAPGQAPGITRKTYAGTLLWIQRNGNQFAANPTEELGPYKAPLSISRPELYGAARGMGYIAWGVCNQFYIAGQQYAPIEQNEEWVTYDLGGNLSSQRPDKAVMECFLLFYPSPFAELGVGKSFIPRMPTGQYYSVAYEMELSVNLYRKGYYSHFKAANTSLNNAMLADQTFANSMTELGINIPRNRGGSIAGASPQNWTWHHDIGAGLMQLVPKNQHTFGSPYWNSLHPNGIGGMALWGRK